jgi:hypothetical protein
MFLRVKRVVGQFGQLECPRPFCDLGIRSALGRQYPAGSFRAGDGL